VAIANI